MDRQEAMITMQVPTSRKDEKNDDISVWDDMKNFLENTSSTHGFARAISSKFLFQRIYWIIIIIGCMTALAFQGWFLTQDYFSYPSTVKVEIRQAKELDFPSVTFCSLNPVLKNTNIFKKQTRMKELIQSYKQFKSCDSLSDENEESEENFKIQEFCHGMIDCNWDSDIYQCICDDPCDSMECAGVNFRNTNEDLEDSYCMCSKNVCDYVSSRRDCYSLYDNQDSNSSTYYDDLYNSETTSTYNDTLENSFDYHCYCDAYQNNQLKEDEINLKMMKKFESHQTDLVRLIKASKTFDLSDVPSSIMEPGKHDFLTDMKKQEKEFAMLVKSCTINGRVCGVKDFEMRIYAKYGLCFTFNQDGDFVTRHFGTHSGLRLVLNIPENEAPLMPNKGFRVIIHEPNTYPWPDVDGFNIHPKMLTSVAINLEQVMRLKTSGQSCVDEFNLFSDLDQAFDYTEQTCLHYCMELATYNQCNCWVHKEFLPKDFYVKKETCNSVNQMTCRSNLMKNLICDKCIPKCNESIYNPIISTALIDSSYYNFVREVRKTSSSEPNGKCKKDSTLNLSALHIYYKNSRYKQLKEKLTYSESTFLSNIGGTFGLFLGFSVISLLEIIELLIFIIIKLVNKFKN